MRIRGGMVAGVAALFAFTSTAVAQTPEVNSYESGGLTPDSTGWEKVYSPAPDRMRVVPSPTDPTHNVMRVELRGGDLYSGGGARAEVGDRLGPNNSTVFSQPDYAKWPDYLKERWYSWRTYLEPGFAPLAIPGWGTIITQWHSINSGGASPPFAVLVDTVTNEFELHRQGTQFTDLNSRRWSAAATPGMWHTFLFHVKWSPSASDGFAELWHNGVNVVPRTSTSTMILDDRPVPSYAANYLKQGIYRHPSVTATQVLYHDTIRIGETRAQVEP